MHISIIMGEKQDLDTEKDIYNLEKTNDAGSVVNLDEEQEENSRIEAVRLGRSLHSNILS